MTDEVHVWRAAAAASGDDSLLRQILGRYAGDVEFEKGARGKPRLVRTSSGADVRFNVSHSGDHLLVAVAVGREVGVDLQRCDAAADALERFFTETERSLLAALSDEDRRRLRARLWAGKEAVLKATGEGIDGSLGRLDVSGLAARKTMVVRRAVPGETSAREWFVQVIEVGDAYAGAVVVEGAAPAVVVLRNWPAEG